MSGTFHSYQILQIMIFQDLLQCLFIRNLQLLFYQPRHIQHHSVEIIENKKIDFLKLLTFYLGALLVSSLILIPYLIINKNRTENAAGFLLFVAASGATISALISTLVFNGKPGLKILLADIIKVRFKWYWYAVSIFLMPLIIISLWFFGRNFNIPFENPLPKLQGFVPVFIIISIQAGLGEEVGWRGLMTPTLNRNMGLFPSAVITGILWGFWHSPLFFIEEMFQYEIAAQVGFFAGMSWYILFLVGSSILYSFIVKKSGGSLIGAILFHGSLNSTTWLVNANDVSVSLSGLKTLTIATLTVSILVFAVTYRDACWKKTMEIN